MIHAIQATSGELDEAYWIAWFRDAGHPLLNATEGGPGMRGYVASEATRARVSASLMGHPVSSETRAKIRAARAKQIMRPRADSTKEALRLANSGPRPERRKTHCPKGHAYTEENTYIGRKPNDRRCRTCNRLRGRV